MTEYQLLRNAYLVLLFVVLAVGFVMSTSFISKYKWGFLISLNILLVSILLAFFLPTIFKKSFF